VSSLVVAWAAVFGAAASAFVPRIAHRVAVPSGHPPRSACADCATPFPHGPAGWVRAGAACRCGTAPWRTVLAGAVAGGLLGHAFGADPVLPVGLLAAVFGLLLAVIDVRCLRLPDPLVGALAVTIVAPLTAAAAATGDPWRLGRALLVAALSFTAYLLIAIGSNGGLGLGDVKLAGVLGFALGFAGWPAVLAGLALPHLINGPIALCLLVSGRAGRQRALPLGPALLAGTLLAVTTV
jgi:leader peptidase (prepilin peptidase) / N-methyltransferase